MARLSKTKIPGFEQRNGEDWSDFYERQGETLKDMARQSAAIPEGGDVKGALVKFSVADGYAHYVVKTSRPLALVHVPYGDAYQASAATIRGLREADIRHQLRYERMLDKTAQKSEDFYASLEEGQTVHFSHGFGAYVRCEAARGKDLHTGEDRMVLKPVALVGEWREYDLPKRDLDGTVRWGYQVDKIRSGDTFHPHDSCIWEAGGAASRDPDPTGLDPVDVSGPPELDGGGQEEARLWRLVARVREATATTLGNPREKLDAVKALMGQA